MILRDRFATNDASYQAVTVRSVSVARVALDLGLDNAGIGKFWEKGTLDVGGEIYSSGVLISTPIGSITMFAADTAPSGWLLCRGQAVSRTTYADLFAVIGTIYGVGNGSTTFNLPDLQGRVPVGVSTGETEFNTIGKTGGAKTESLTASQIPPHTHSFANSNAHAFSWGGVGGTDVYAQNAIAAAGGPPSNNLTTHQGNWNKTANDGGGGQAHNNLQPYRALNFIIKVN